MVGELVTLYLFAGFVIGGAVGAARFHYDDSTLDPLLASLVVVFLWPLLVGVLTIALAVADT